MNPRGCLRSALFLPASNLRAIAKASELPCDCVILDLEDGVAPAAKSLARTQALDAVRGGAFRDQELVVRVNAFDTEWGPADFEAVASVNPDAILVPKIATAADLSICEERLGYECKVPLWAMIETARSILAISDIASVATYGRLKCLVMGTNDLAKETGARMDAGRTAFTGALGLAVIAARAFGLQILDGVFNDFNDESGFASECAQAVSFGFDGKTLIHPRQIEICNAAFAPDEAAIAWAEKVIRAFDDPCNAEKGAINIDGKMVERLHLELARRTLAAVSIPRSHPRGDS